LITCNFVPPLDIVPAQVAVAQRPMSGYEVRGRGFLPGQAPWDSHSSLTRVGSVLPRVLLVTLLMRCLLGWSGPPFAGYEGGLPGQFARNAIRVES
jgi:hypothetical protein